MIIQIYIFLWFIAIYNQGRIDADNRVLLESSLLQHSDWGTRTTHGLASHSLEDTCHNWE